MRTGYRFAVALVSALALALPALPAGAQQQPTAPATSAAAAPAADAPAAPVAGAPEAIMRAHAPLPLVTFEAAREDAAPETAFVAPTRRASVALMVVGAAAMVVGSLIDGDTGTIFMVGGAAVGLWGLYNYLR